MSVRVDTPTNSDNLCVRARHALTHIDTTVILLAKGFALYFKTYLNPKTLNTPLVETLTPIADS